MIEKEKDENTISNSSASSGMSKGLFGETDRSSGEYHFRSGRTQQVYSNARYIPVDESTTPPKYYKPSGSSTSAASDSAKAARKKTGVGFFAVLAICLSCAVLGGLAGAAVMSSAYNARITALENALSQQSTAAAEPIPASDESQAYSAAAVYSDEISYSNALSATEIYNNACGEVVSINVETAYRDRDGYVIPSTVSGSGFVITEDGYILTNYHVVEKAAEGGFPVIVTFYNSDSYNGDVIGYDESCDIALVKIDASNLQTATLGDSSSIQVGDDVYAVGNPFNILDFTMTSGHISALNRLIATEENENAIEMFQIDAAVYDGNSGGPLYNNLGEVVGIVTAKYSATSDVNGIGFAIPINAAAEAMAGLLDNSYNDYINSKASLGASFDDRYNSMYSRYYDMPVGAFVYNVEEGSCAEKAGLMSGDIITKIGDTDINNYEDLKQELKKYKAGDTADIEFYRDAEVYTVTVTFDEAESSSYPSTQSLVDAGLKRG